MKYFSTLEILQRLTFPQYLATCGMYCYTGNKSSKPKQRQQQVEEEPEFNPPYARPSRAKAPVEVAHSMDEIRESSGFYFQSQEQRRQEQEMARIRRSAVMPRTSQAYYAPSPSQTHSVPTSPRSYHAPTSPQSYHVHNSPQPYYAPAASNHEREMALIRESSGAHLC